MKRALVAGGGIAGLAAALALARAGWSVTVFEASPALGEVGAGLQMSPNASRVLRWLGVLDAVAETAFRPERALLRDGRSGQTVFHTPLGQEAVVRWGAPYLHVHRADLLSALSRAAAAAGVETRTGARVESVVTRPEGPALRLAQGESIAGDLVIGADGIRSALRAQINGPEAPDFSGQVAWRGTIPAERLPRGLVAPAATVWGGDGRHLVTYFLRGGQLVNFVAVEERAEWTAEGWSVPGDPEDLRRSFAGWHPDVTRLLDAVDTTFLWGLFTRPEQVRWVEGALALIGDAAHPMLPFMAQGAAMALEDVGVLAACLSRGADIPAALAAFEARRWPRVARVQHRSRDNGRLFHLRAGLARAGRWGLIGAVSRLAPGLAASQLDWLYGYDALAATG